MSHTVETVRFNWNARSKESFERALDPALRCGKVAKPGRSVLRLQLKRWNAGYWCSQLTLLFQSTKSP
jgi:hypothetical protein